MALSVTFEGTICDLLQDWVDGYIYYKKMVQYNEAERRIQQKPLYYHLLGEPNSAIWEDKWRGDRL